jgi:hypothetical protein
MQRKLRVLCLTLVLALFGSPVPSQADPVIYSQPSNFPLSAFIFSTNDTAVSNIDSRAFDNFTLLDDSSITDLHWQGSFLLGEPAQITQFTITFWSNNAGQPGSPLLTEAFLGNANQTAVGNDSAGVPTFNYFVDLTTPFHATGGTPYWVSIVADVAFPPVWAWHNGTGGDGVFFAQIAGGAPVLLLGDLAFDLTGTVPEPGTLSLVGLGLLGLIAQRWHRGR